MFKYACKCDGMLKECFHSIIALRCLITLCERCYVKQLQCTKNTHIDNIRATRHHFAEISGKRKANSRAEGKERAFLILFDVNGAQARCHTTGHGSHTPKQKPFSPNIVCYCLLSSLCCPLASLCTRCCDCDFAGPFRIVFF